MNRRAHSAQDSGIPSLQVALYPDPFDLETDAQLREKSAKIVVPQIIDALTKPITASKDSVAKRDSREIVFTGTIDQINRYFTDKGWSDGMSITPPTKEKVEEFLKYTDYAPDQEIAVLPVANLRATPWNIAVNGVMAGCRPEHMPILIAAVQAIADPAFRYANNGGSTHSFMNFFWVNGPLARQLGIDHGQGLIAHPVNSVIGRAMSLIERNIAGFRIKETQMGSFGKQLSWVLAEDEEAMSQTGMGTVPCGERVCKERKHPVRGEQHRVGPQSDPLDVRSEDPHADHGLRDRHHGSLCQRLHGSESSIRARRARCSQNSRRRGLYKEEPQARPHENGAKDHL